MGTPPLFPAMPRLKVPAGVVVKVVTVMVDVPLPAMVAGLNDAVAPEGKPVALKGTLPVKPLRAVTVMV